jgi:hypothetical protein
MSLIPVYPVNLLESVQRVCGDHLGSSLRLTQLGRPWNLDGPPGMSNGVVAKKPHAVYSSLHTAGVKCETMSALPMFFNRMYLLLYGGI